MIALREFQSSMMRALLAGGDHPPPHGFDPGKVPVAEGLAIYRNTVFATLTEALGDLFPVTKQLVGDGFLAYAAHEFIQRHPPSSPVLSEYGAAFPDFLEAFEPARTVPYLADVARLELARHQAYNAADAVSLDAGALTAIPETRLGGLRLTPHPSIRLCRSAYPVDSIWKLHQGGNGPTDIVDLPDCGCSLLIGRPREQVETLTLEDGALDFVDRLIAGDTLAEAFALTGGDWNVQSTLTDLLLFGAFTEFELSEETR